MVFKRYAAVAPAAVILIGLMALPALAYTLGGSGPGQYVALGDSYSAGEGLQESYYEGTNDKTNQCHRSSLAYGPQLAQDLTNRGWIKDGHWLFPACSGDLAINLFIGSGGDNTTNKVRQLDYLDEHTKFVTLTVGGNDVGFPAALQNCLEEFQDKKAWWRANDGGVQCQQTLDNADDLIADGVMATQLVRTYRAILKRAPFARLVLVTYPRLFPEPADFNGQNVDGTKYCVVAPKVSLNPRDHRNLGFRSDTIERFNAAAKALNDLIVELAGDLQQRDGLAGRVTVARADLGEMATHPFACGDENEPTEYINGLRYALPSEHGAGPNESGRPVSKASFHPNKEGQAALFRLVSGAITRAVPLSVTVDGQTSLRVGGSGQVEATAHNGTPHWSNMDSPSSAASYPTVSFEGLPNSGLEIQRLFRSGLDRATLTYKATAPGSYSFDALVIDAHGTTARERVTVEVSASLTSRVSVSSSGGQGNHRSFESSQSADGRFVAFTSAATTMAPPDTKRGADVFVRDQQTGVTTRVSVSSSGELAASGYADYPSISADGRYVAFVSNAPNLVPGDTNNTVDVFVHDRETQLTRRVSVSSAGIQGDRGSQYPTISANGRHVVFDSSATNLVDGTSDYTGIFMHDLESGVTSRVSVSSTGAQANSYSGNASVSGDGRIVVFTSRATNLVPSDTNVYEDVFMHDRQSGMTTKVSVSSAGEHANAFARHASISADGRYVGFESWATNLVTGDTNGALDVFLRDLQTNETTRVSVTTDGVQGNSHSYYKPAFSADGRYVAFTSVATNLEAGETNTFRYQIFVRDRLSGTTERASVSSEGTPANGDSYWPSISADGRHVGFTSGATNLVANDTNAVDDVFVRQR
jgi:Tol biopolymer transport system component/lysophospholipase L1-like esterase